MTISVIVVSYNSRTYLTNCLGSIIPELGSDDELIVVDNGSSDGSADLVAEQFPSVRLARAENHGYAGGNNQGAALACGDTLVFLNPDTTVEPGAIAALAAPLEADPTIGLTTACIVHMHRPELINTCGNTMHYTGLTYCRGAGRPRSDYMEPASVDAVSGAAFAISRALFNRLGGFDTRFFMYCEDSDLSWRARMLGASCLYVPNAVVRHDYRPDYTPTKAFFLERNRHLMLLKNLRRDTYLRMLPGLLLAELVTWVFNLLHGPRYWDIKLRVYWALYCERASIGAIYTMACPSGDVDRTIVRSMTTQLEFEQLANQHLAWLARVTLHPAFRAARLLFA
jgi:GT2 family glycosyltransferase